MKLINIFFRTLKECNFKNYKIFKELLTTHFLYFFKQQNQIMTTDNVIYTFSTIGQTYFINLGNIEKAETLKDVLITIHRPFIKNILISLNNDIIEFFEINNITKDIIKYANINVDNKHTIIEKNFYIKKWINNHNSLSAFFSSDFMFYTTTQGVNFWFKKTDQIKHLILCKILS